MQSLHAPETVHKGPADEPLGSYGDVTHGPYSSEIALNIQCVDPHFIFISLQSKKAKKAGTVVYAIGVALYDIQQVH